MKILVNEIDLLSTVCVNDTKKCQQTPSTPAILWLFRKAFMLYLKIACRKFIRVNVMDNVWLFLFDVATSCLLTTVQLFSEIHKNIDRVSNCRYEKCCIFCCKKRSKLSNSFIADCIATNKLAWIAFRAERFQKVWDWCRQEFWLLTAMNLAYILKTSYCKLFLKLFKSSNMPLFELEFFQSSRIWV